MNLRNNIFDLIEKERAAQDETWGGAGHDDNHFASDWVGFIERHTMKMDDAINDGDDDAYRRQLVRVAALCVAALESSIRLEHKQEARDGE